ncbi:MAG: UDP-N-acetylmuramate dehydrogenase [Verrucomicrobia bacterium]|nr:UDP-N-acetylmuramate dehydrogenase [Verrucomicrobiota bacterium]
MTTEQIGRLLEAAAPNTTIYLVGVGGCGMSGLAHLLLDLGFRVVGSDLSANEETRQLAERGATIHIGHRAEQLVAAQPILVGYSSAIRRDNPELQAAEQRQIPLARRALLLAALVHRQQGICVAGMHGKTTTSALLAFALEKLGAAPSYAIGALVPQLPRHAKFAGGSSRRESAQIRPGAQSAELNAGDQSRLTSAATESYFVAEADESDGTLSEFRPQHAIVLNVDAEHLDFYANLDAICSEFANFAQQTRDTLVFCADDARLAELFARRPGAVSYGFHPLANYRLVVEPSNGSRSRGNEAQIKTDQSLLTSTPTGFEVWHSGAKLGDFTIRLNGEKNVSNAGAVVALLHRLGYAPDAIASAIADFSGAARRQQELFSDARFRVFDDYGHHPAEIQATLQAFRSLGARRSLVAFQPHRFTRTQALMSEFATSFGQADLLWVADIYAASEPEIPGVTSAKLVEAILDARSSGRESALLSPIGDRSRLTSAATVKHVPSLDALRRAVRAAMLPGDVVLFLGAGDITKAAHELAAELREEAVSSNEQTLAALTACVSPESIVRRDEPLAKRTTLRVGGKADYYVEPASEVDLSRVLKLCAERQLKFTLLGRGSNLLIKDGGIRGVVICLNHPNFSRLEIIGDKLHCGPGVKLKAISVEARRAGLAGLEFLEGIPGSLGGSMRMNAGAMGSWLFDVVEKIRFMDYSGVAHERVASEVNVEYRGCPLLKTNVALGAVLKGQPTAAETVAARMQQYSSKRWESQPKEPSAGCIFKNPKTIPAGKLIDELGLKGTRVGGAMVSDVHGNFIVNADNATASDVLSLIEVVKQRAKSARGIELETEVEILGRVEGRLFEHAKT